MALSDLQTDYAGKKGRLFRLASWAGLLTVLSLGMYRFWMKTRLRRYYWSAIRPGGHPLEYVGLPLEKLLGFLIAVAFLAFYIGIVNLILMFLSFSLFQGNFVAYILSFIGVIPILFFARYRARRYILARTRWRGLRFGMEQGAWGYSWRAMVHWLITIGSLGLLWPRMTFWLEKYRTDRTYFGTERFDQGGSWQMLYRPFLPFLTGLVILAMAAVFSYQENIIPALVAGCFALVLCGYGLAHYSVHSFRKLTNTKSLGPIGFVARPRPWRVVRIYLLGYTFVFTILFLLVAAMMGAALAIIIGVGVGGDYDIDLFNIGSGLPFWISIILATVVYFAVFLGWGVLRQVFVSLPLARHYSETLEITGTVALASIGQRDRDEFTEAEGFAEALDVGAAI